MKKVIFSFLALALFVNVVPTIVNASEAVFLPEQVLFGTSSVYNAGEIGNMTFVNSVRSVGKKQNIEYGVAQTYTTGLITSFEILTTKEADISKFDSIPGLSVEIPNVVQAQGTSSPKTYVAYIKYLEKNNPDNVHFYFSREFSIKPNSTPFTYIKNVNLLMSRGERYATTDGPTIYTAEEAATDAFIATSTSLEITFESNVDTVLTPKITFTKLRSNSFNEEFVPQQITIKKGLNYLVIPLPVFDYEPGVYKGQVTFGSDVLKNTVDLQYIVAGESVTVGDVSLIKKENKDHASFEIFSTPIDLQRGAYDLSTTSPSEIISSSTPVFYTATISLLGKDGKVLGTIDQQVDFMQPSFSIEIPQEKFKKLQIERVSIKVVSPRTSKVVYEGVKDFTHTSNPEINLMLIAYVIVYILLIITVLYFAFKRNIKLAIVFAILLGSLFFAKTAFGLAEGLFPANDAYLLSWKPTESRLINQAGQNTANHFPKFYFQEDLSTKTFTCGLPKTVTFAVRYVMCSNSVPVLQVGASMANIGDAQNTRSNLGLVLQEEYAGSAQGHNYYTRISDFRSATVPQSGAGVQTLYLHAYHKPASNVAEIYAGNSNYAIPITTGACTACTNASSTSNVPNFELHGRTYYYSSADSKLYYRDGSVSPSEPAASCGIDMCSDTSAIETGFPAGKSWRPMPGTNSTTTNRYACLPINITCDCNSSRDRVCTNSNTGTTSTEVAHPSCVFQAYCSVSYPQRGYGNVSFNAYNKKGTLSFDPTGNPVENVEIPPDLSTGITITKKVIDNFDGRSSTVSCVLKYSDSVTNNEGDASIISFYASPRVVSEGAMCKFGWETNNMTSCTISGVTVPVNALAGDLYTLDGATSTGDTNLTKTLICSGRSTSTAPLVTVSTSTTCFVNPRIREN